MGCQLACTADGSGPIRALDSQTQKYDSGCKLAAEDNRSLVHAALGYRGIDMQLVIMSLRLNTKAWDGRCSCVTEHGVGVVGLGG